MQQKILFVCLGNICRSPLAEGIMLHLIDRYRLAVSVDSAGTAGYHIGQAPDRRTIQNAEKNGIPLSALRARQFVSEDLDHFDHIYVMDKENHRVVMSMCTSPEQKNKVDLFLNTIHPSQNLEVPDPYYGSEKDFEHVFQLVYKTCDELCSKLKNS